MTMPLSQEDAYHIVQRLLERTTAGNLKWELWTNGVEYEAATDRFTYYIKARDEDDNPPYRLELWRHRDRGGGAVKVAEITTAEGATFNHFLSQLYGAVKIQSLGIDNLKDDVLRDLD